MQISELIPLLERFNSPLGWLLSFILFILPVLIGAFRSALLFHDEYVRHYRTKNFEVALSKVREGSAEHRLLEECKTQELIYINTKLNLSQIERLQVLDWLSTKPVTISLIKKSWPNIHYENGRLTPKIPRYEKIYAWYMPNLWRWPCHIRHICIF